MKLLRIFNNFLKRKIEKKKLVIQENQQRNIQVIKDREEYILINEKKSKLSKKERDLVCARIKAWIALGYIKIIDDEKETE